MSKIKRFKLIDNFTVDGFRNEYGIRDGGSWACDGAKHFIFKTIFFRDERGHEFEFSIYLCFPDDEDMSKWNDLDYILVLDEDFCQPYTPFYTRFGEEIGEDFWCLKTFIEKYNDWMGSLKFLKEVG